MMFSLRSKDYIELTPISRQKLRKTRQLPMPRKPKRARASAENGRRMGEWGYAKRVYRLNPESSREDHLEKFALNALEAVPLKSMRKFANRSRHFMDAYERGLNGQQAAWAARKYRGHRVLPAGIMDELDKMGIV
jgi:hypothetical protein